MKVLRVARSSRALVSASRRNELSTPRHSESARAPITAPVQKFVAAGRRDQRSGRARYPEFLALALLIFVASFAKAADWPMHRGGPQLQGIAAMAAPPKADLAWTFTAGKPVKGAAAIADNRVFFGDDAGVVHALDLGNGKEKWTFKTEGSIEATPLVLDGVVFIGSSDSNLYALDAATGALKWKYTTGDKILGGANHAKNPTGDGEWILVGSYDSSLHCVDAATGKVVWTHATDNYINGAPAIFSTGEIVFGGCDAAIHVLQLKDGAELRQIDSEAYIASSVAIADGIGYVGNYGNQVLAFDPQKGAITWKYHDRNFPYFSSAAVTADRVIIGGRDKQLHCIDRATGMSVWKFAARGPIDSSPVVCADAIIVGCEDGRLYCVNLADGRERWAYEIGAPITSSPAVADGRIVVGAEDGNVYCFGAAIPAHAADNCPACKTRDAKLARLGRDPGVLKSILQNSDPADAPAFPKDP